MIYLLWHGWGGGIFCENLINEAMQQGKRYHYESGRAKKTRLQNKTKRQRKEVDLSLPAAPLATPLCNKG